MRWGDLELQRVEEARIDVPVALLTGGTAKMAGSDLQSFQLVFQSWILRHRGLVILIDPCAGNGRDRPVMPHFHQLETPYLDRLRATGIAPEQVDIVFCTHLHCDHCGWNTRRQDGRWVPTFPNARYLLVRKEVERWGNSRDDHAVIDYNVGVFEDSVQPILEAGLADLVEAGHRVAPGVWIESAPGHTFGHSILRVAQDGGEIIFTGDCFHHPLQIADCSLHLGGCDDLDQAIATRERLRGVLAETGALMVPAHFEAPHMGHVVKQDGQFRFRPWLGR